MFNVIFSTFTYNGNVSSVAVSFPTEEEADIAIKVFKGSDRQVTATRLYRQTLEYSIEWAGNDGKRYTTEVRGYTKNEAVDSFLQQSNLRSNNIINVNELDKFAHWSVLK